jgi:hypothetical protein
MLMPRKNDPIQNLVCVKARSAKRISPLWRSGVPKLFRLGILVKNRITERFSLIGLAYYAGITVISARLFVSEARGAR